MQAWMVSVTVLSLLLACDREQSSGAARTADTGQTAMLDTASAVAPRDTVRQPATAPDTTAIPPDTATRVARRPAVRKPTPKPAPKPAAKPVTPTPSQADTGGAATSAPAAPSPTTEASAPLRDQYHTAPLDTVSQQVYDGWKQYNLNCARCHGEDVQGTTIAPHLIVSLKPDGPIKTKELFVQTVCAGRPEKGMPSWCALGMEMPTIEAIYSYVKGRSDAKIHPGRPALKAGG